jgi:maltooligosyltrehalose trehalohydrolase
MLFMGEEYGEDAPFQFFTDHIDEEIATATRDGRRREFASFAAFAGQEVPDPQAESTFLASKLTRRTDEDLLNLHRDLLALRPTLPRGEAQAVGDEQQRWVRVTRGDHHLLMNLSDREQPVPTTKSQVVLTTHPVDAAPTGDHLVLPAFAGAVVR